jgi:hypothetical protein
LLLAFAACLICITLNTFAQSPQGSTNSHSKSGYAGSQECALCHPDIYEKYMRTDMGRSMTVAQKPPLKIPATASIFDQRLNRHFDLSSTAAGSTQSEYETASDGREIFRETETIEWLIGAGENGIGGIVKRGDYLFEAPLSYYRNANTWALSPGFEYADYGFSRPILPGCISCHSGRPQPAPDGNGHFQKQAFAELAIGCESCHGPGEAHIAAASPETIVNPAKLSGWLADNICLECHQSGDARVLHSGRDYSDFVPGEALDETLSIFMVPFSESSAPKDDLLEHYLSMRLSKCYRQSNSKLSCITCHDPHTQPTASEAPAYFRQRCLSCHTEQSCTLPLPQRQKTSPPDNCIGCHMPKREVTVISHSVLTNHRIVRTAQEPFPETAFHMTTPGLPDLVQLSAAPGSRASPLPLVRLQAYRQLVTAHPEYREAYWKLAQQLQAAYPNDITVLEGLTDASLHDKSANGVAEAISYLDKARAQGTTQAADFEELGRLLNTSRQWNKAIDVLKQGVDRVPYDKEIYRLLTQAYFSSKDMKSACQVSTQALQLFPQDDNLRAFVGKKCTQP